MIIYNEVFNPFSSRFGLPLHNTHSGPALSIAGPYAKRIAWGLIWVGIKIITIVVISVGPLEVCRDLASVIT